MVASATFIKQRKINKLKQMLTSYQHSKSHRVMKQLDLLEALFAEPKQEVVEKVSSVIPFLSPAEVRECFREEQAFGFGGRLYRQARELAKQELKEIEAGRVFVSKRYLKMLRSY